MEKDDQNQIKRSFMKIKIKKKSDLLEKKVELE
jgi:hypothetical protein